MQTVKGVKVRCIKLLKNKVYKFARYSYVELDDQFYITNIIEKKIISRYFNAGAYIFEDSTVFCRYFEKLSCYKNLFMSHVVYFMLLDKILFRPFIVKDFEDWGSNKAYNYFVTNK